MAFENVLAPGASIDVTVSEIEIDGQSLPAAVVEWDWKRTTEEEKTWFQGNVLPQERTQGQEDFEVTMMWGGRQWERWKADYGGWDEIRGREFNITTISRPKNDDKMYEVNFIRLRFLNEGGKFGKEAYKQELTCSVMNITSTPFDA